ncbi:nuclear transport factor 2 family protein [Parahaliea mediterranea]|uniref:Nuclear transport factor 2 family protein n=1 Tax=Parahaliea mediterranea TaxID=651086 RepID=A0A939DES1_9GAMM|nr:nuclear transport factor 2 family protein [Parahaliea mediterranea]MBN7796192.1 nuclear transport factor 2 family protein [Parahaliea mediterranea]
MNNNILTLALGAALGATLAGAPALADQAADREKLIALDKSWGEARDATSLKKLLDPQMIGIAPQGVADRDRQIAIETAPGASAGPYEPADYKVHFIDDDVAIMVHSVRGTEPHYSMHVWEEDDGVWRVVATATTPMAK